jgi:5'-nucleotidase
MGDEVPYSLDDKLVVAISSRALFSLDEANAVFEADGLDAYREYQREHENDPLDPGTGMPLVGGLLRINEVAGQPLVEVIVLSKNDADTGLRIFNSIEHHSLTVTRAAFTDGADPMPYLRPFFADLFLSNDPEAVESALRGGFPAATMLAPPDEEEERLEGPVKIAFDGDAVLFDDESERVFQDKGLEAFQEREAELANVPMSPGPFKPFLEALGRVQQAVGAEQDAIRIALVTARNAPANKRVVNTLREWNVRVDESFFLGGVAKDGVLSVLRPHIFFDDQQTHLVPARVRTPSAHVPGPTSMPPKLPTSSRAENDSTGR